MSALRLCAAAAALTLLLGCAGAPAAPPQPAGPAASAAAVAPPPAAAAAPPAAKPATGAMSLVNPGFESSRPGQSDEPLGWFTFQHAGDKSYAFTLDTADPHGGARSLRIEHIGPEPYGAVAQSLDVSSRVGKVARYSAWMRTRDVTGTGAGLTLMVLSKGAIIDQNFMSDRIVTGTTGWTRYTLTLRMPRGAERLEIGAMQQGPGTLWLDDAVLEFVDP